MKYIKSFESLSEIKPLELVSEFKPIFMDCIDDLENMDIIIPDGKSQLDTGNKTYMRWWIDMPSKRGYVDSSGESIDLKYPRFIIGSIPDRNTCEIILKLFRDKKEQIESQIDPIIIEITGQKNIYTPTFWIGIIVSQQ